MKYIFDVYDNNIKGIIEVEAKDDQDALEKVSRLGLKFSRMVSSNGIFKIQYTSCKKWNF